MGRKDLGDVVWVFVDDIGMLGLLDFVLGVGFEFLVVWFLSVKFLYFELVDRC